MGWARALGEFGATILFAGAFPGRTQTMPLAIYAALETDLDTTVVLAAILAVAALRSCSASACSAGDASSRWSSRRGQAAPFLL